MDIKKRDTSIRVLKFLRNDVQLWSKSKFEDFKNDSEKYDHTEMELKYSLDRKTYKIMSKFFNLRWGFKENKHGSNITKPEKITAEILQELGIDYIREKYMLDMKYRVDFYLTKSQKTIEVHGDYYHANPSVYDYAKLYPIQKSNVLRDIKRRQDFLEAGIPLLEIWENDIYTKREFIKQKIKEYEKK